MPGRSCRFKKVPSAWTQRCDRARLVFDLAYVGAPAARTRSIDERTVSAAPRNSACAFCAVGDSPAPMSKASMARLRWPSASSRVARRHLRALRRRRAAPAKVALVSGQDLHRQSSASRRNSM
jgi:hypothetical protein